MATYVVLARNADYTIAGALRTYALSATLNFNAVGSIEIGVPLEVCPTGWPHAGAGVVVVRDNQVWASGTWDQQAYSWSADSESDDGGPGKLTLTFDTDLGRLAYRIVYPKPDVSWTDQQDLGAADDDSGAWYEASGNAETLLRNLVNLNAGAGAVAARREPHLTLDVIAGVGEDTTVKERFTPLLDAMRTVALAGGGLGFDVRQDLSSAQSLKFSVYQPVDRTASVRFSPELGNLASLSLEHSAPTANVVLTAGSGQKNKRNTLETPNDDSVAEWGRRETFRDQRQAGADPADEPTTEEQEEAWTEMEKDAADALVEGDEQASFTATAIDTPSCTYGVHYNLGDKVSAGVDSLGFVVSEVVRAVQVQVDEKGNEEVTVSIGTGDEDQTGWLKPVKDLEKRLSYLERAQ